MDTDTIKLMQHFSNALKNIAEAITKDDQNYSSRFVLANEAIAHLKKFDNESAILLSQPEKEIEPQSLGKLISEKMLKNRVRSIPDIPESIVQNLKEDNVYPNTIPVVLFRNMLRLLDIDIEEAIEAMYWTFDILQAKPKSPKQETEDRIKGAALWQNKISYDKYIAHLKNLWWDKATPSELKLSEMRSRGDEKLVLTRKQLKDLVAQVGYSMLHEGMGGCSVLWHWSSEWMKNNKQYYEFNATK